MSRSPNFFLIKTNSDGTAKRLTPFVPAKYVYDEADKGKLIPADLWPYNGSHDLFEMIEDMKFCGVHNGLPQNCPKEIVEEYEKEKSEEWSWMPSPYYFSYMAMAYELEKNPKAIDWEETEDSEHPIYKDAPLKALKDRVDMFLSVLDEDWNIETDMDNIFVVAWIC